MFSPGDNEATPYNRYPGARKKRRADAGSEDEDEDDEMGGVGPTFRLESVGTLGSTEVRCWSTLVWYGPLTSRRLDRRRWITRTMIKCSKHSSVYSRYGTREFHSTSWHWRASSQTAHHSRNSADYVPASQHLAGTSSRTSNSPPKLSWHRPKLYVPITLNCTRLQHVLIAPRSLLSAVDPNR